jgi:Methyltransferase domain
MSETGPALRGALGLDPVRWMMAPSERLAIVGLLTAMEPRRVLELGCADGGLTTWLSRQSAEVVTVDIDEKVMRVTRDLPNVTALHMTSDEAVRQLEAAGRRFDLTIIDADHSEAGVRRDLANALRFSDVILMHDTYYPPCRKGILDALAGRDVYYDLDLVPGGMQPDGLWGGVGVVIPGLRRGATAHVTPRLSTYPWLRRRWLLRQYADRARASARRLFGGG